MSPVETKTMAKPRWSELEDRILRVVVGLGGKASDVAIHTGRSKAAVHCRVWALGLSFRAARHDHERRRAGPPT
jgi:hypothetical protein